MVFYSRQMGLAVLLFACVYIAFSAANSNTSVFTDPETFTLDSLSTDAAWMLAVVQSDGSEVGSEWTRTKKWAEGAIRTAELTCGSAAEEVAGGALGQELCGGRGPASKLPYVLILPYGVMP